MNEYNDEPIDISPDGEVYTMLAQKEGTQIESQGQESDVYSMLAQKERDLILAAELGKALLEKNQELAIRHQQLIEEYSQKIEVCGHFNHGFMASLFVLHILNLISSSNLLKVFLSWNYQM